MKQSNQPCESAVSIVDASFTERFASVSRHAESWSQRLTEERRDLESLLDTRVSAEAAAQLDLALFGTEVRCPAPSLRGRGSWSDDSFWNAFDDSLKTVVAYEARLETLETELKSLGARVAALRTRALTTVDPEGPCSLHEDLRRSPRIAVRTEVEIASELGGARGLTGNISNSGLFIASASLPARGVLVDLALLLPEVGWVEARAVVRWSRRFDAHQPQLVPGIGVEFVALDEHSLQAVKEFLAMREASLRRP